MVIVSGELVQRIMTALADPESHRTFTAIHDEPKTTFVMEKELSLPVGQDSIVVPSLLYPEG